MTTLSQLTMRRYIDLVCGDLAALDEPGATREQLVRHRNALMFEFARLSDSAGTKMLVAGRRSRQRVHAELTLFQVIGNIIALGGFDDARALLKNYGISRDMTDLQLADEVKRLRMRAETEVKRQAESKPEESRERTPDEIRTYYDGQAASLMTYFKFQIDLGTITASQFACMTDQARREIKARMIAAKIR